TSKELFVAISGCTCALDTHHLNALQRERLNQGVQFVIDEEESGAGVSQDEVDFLRIQPAVDGDQDATSSRNTIMSFKQSRRIGAQESDAIVFLQAHGTQVGSHAVHSLRTLAVAILLLPIDHGNCPGKNRGTTLTET